MHAEARCSHFPPNTGYLKNRYGRMAVLMGAFIMAAMMDFAMPLSLNLAILGIMRFLIGIPFAFITTGIRTVLTDIAPEDVRTESFSYFSILVMLTVIVLGPNRGFRILKNYGFPILFITAGLLSTLAKVVLKMMKFEDIKNPDNVLSLDILC